MDTHTLVDRWLQDGRALHDHGQYDEAIAVYQRILGARPDHAGALYETAYALHAKREHHEAIALLEDILATTGSHAADAHILLGSIHDQLGDWPNGEQVFRAGLERFPGDARLYFNLGLNLLRQGDAATATQALLANLAIRPHHARGWAAIGDARWAADRWATALLAWTRCLTLQPDLACAQLYASTLWQRLFAGVDLLTKTINAPPPADLAENEPSTENIAVAVIAAQRYSQWSSEADADFFAYALEGIVAHLGEYTNEHPYAASFWNRHLLAYFERAQASGYLQAVAYEARLPLQDAPTARWIGQHAELVRRFRVWSKSWKAAPG